MENKQLLKSLTQGKTTSASSGKQSALGGMMDKLKSLPGLSHAAKAAKSAKPKQVADIAIFTLGIYLMYRFGKIVADTIDNQMPTEKSMMEMMRTMQGPPGMPPPPMWVIFIVLA